MPGAEQGAHAQQDAENYIMQHYTKDEIDSLMQRLQARRDALEHAAQQAARPPRLSETLQSQADMLRQLTGVVVGLAETQKQMGKVLEELSEERKEEKKRPPDRPRPPDQPAPQTPFGGSGFYSPQG